LGDEFFGVHVKSDGRFVEQPLDESTPRVLEERPHVTRATLRPGGRHDLDTATAFFVGLGLEVEGTRMFVEGECRTASR